MKYAEYPEPRRMTWEEYGAEKERWYREQDIALLRRKRRSAHRLLLAQQETIRQLRAQLAAQTGG